MPASAVGEQKAERRRAEPGRDLTSSQELSGVYERIAELKRELAIVRGEGSADAKAAAGLESAAASLKEKLAKLEARRDELSAALPPEDAAALKSAWDRLGAQDETVVAKAGDWESLGPPPKFGDVRGFGATLAVAAKEALAAARFGLVGTFTTTDLGELDSAWKKSRRESVQPVFERFQAFIPKLKEELRTLAAQDMRGLDDEAFRKFAAQVEGRHAFVSKMYRLLDKADAIYSYEEKGEVSFFNLYHDVQDERARRKKEKD